MCSCDEQEEKNMGKDIGWKGFLSDDERYADVINGSIFMDSERMTGCIRQRLLFCIRVPNPGMVRNHYMKC